VFSTCASGPRKARADALEEGARASLVRAGTDQGAIAQSGVAEQLDHERVGGVPVPLELAVGHAQRARAARDQAQSACGERPLPSPAARSVAVAGASSAGNDIAE